MHPNPSLGSLASFGLIVLCAGPLSPLGHGGNAVVETDLVSDIPGRALHLDPNLVNPWGIALSATSPFWVADNGTGVSTLYDGEGVARSLVVSVPPAAGDPPPGTPTGVVFNGGTAFEVAPGQAARFIFATEDGTISGWNPTANPTVALRKVDNSAGGAAYKGLAIGNATAGPRLYAANFGTGRIDVFSGGYVGIVTPGAFVDPALPSGYAPFNVQNLGGRLYVTYALREVGGIDDVPGAGNGFVSVFDLDGHFIQRLASGGPLNSPWGMALAPAEFGPFGGKLLVGNFGDGLIHVFDPSTGAFVDSLRNAEGDLLRIPGLWALTFGNDGSGGDADDLYFTAGIAGESHGLFGEIAVLVPETGARLPLFLGACAVGWISWRRGKKHNA
jgi:uncharacterized protein (TIGR03118 family)